MRVKFESSFASIQCLLAIDKRNCKHSYYIAKRKVQRTVFSSCSKRQVTEVEVQT